MNAFTIFGLLAVSLLVSGCCCALTPSSSGSEPGFCPYGTYGETCSEVCTSPAVTDPNCVSTCLDGVREEGLGDATTCCQQTMRQSCDTMCTDLEARTQGDTTKAECMEECLGTYEYVGVNPDLCYVPL